VLFEVLAYSLPLTSLRDESPFLSLLNHRYVTPAIARLPSTKPARSVLPLRGGVNAIEEETAAASAEPQYLHLIAAAWMSSAQ
jgi:hypothetical protein